MIIFNTKFAAQPAVVSLDTITITTESFARHFLTI
jgi:hypothetical protein